MKNKLFAFFTALCMTASMLPTVFAEGGENSDMTIGMSTQEQCSCVTLTAPSALRRVPSWIRFALV